MLDSVEFLRDCDAVFRPPPRLTVSQWADEFRQLSREASAEPGQWVTARAEYQRGIMDAVSDPLTHTIVVMSSSQVGKALALDTPIPTPRGWSTIGTIRSGASVFDERGLECRVIGKSEVFYNRKCYRVMFDDGTSIVADGEHKWQVYDRALKRRTWTTDEIRRRQGESPVASARIQVAQPLRLDSAPVPVDPYVLGAWLGDGNSKSAIISVDTRDGVLANLEAILGPLERVTEKGTLLQVHLGRSKENALCVRGHKKKKGAGKYTSCNECAKLHARAYRRRETLAKLPKPNRGGFHSVLNGFGLIGNKHIPDVYLRGSYAQRMALLQGLMDTDGCAALNGHIELTLTNKRLACDAVELMRSLGLKAVIKKSDAKLYGRVVSDRYRIGATAYSDQPVFRLARKQQRLRSRSDPRARPTETTRRSIVKVTAVDSVPVQCIAVDSPSHLFLAGEAMVPTHNSEMLLNSICYHMAQDPAPILFLQPTLEMAETFAKDRIAPMLRDTPCLNGLVADPRSREGGNTLLHKTFTGGHLTLAGANSPASLASRPIRLVFADEVDRYPPSAGSEGDPITLVTARSKTFHNRKLVLTSTPTIKGVSRIEQAYEESDQRVYELPCPHCGHSQRLMWGQVKWDAGRPETAALYCAECGGAWTDAQRWGAIRKGMWAARKPFRGVAGFHLSELNSPWARVTDMARSFLEAKESRSQERMRAWINTTLGECWEQDGERVDDAGIASRVEEWAGEPEGVLVRTCGVDVQDDRLEVELVGWGKDDESWSLDYAVIFGDPSGVTLWQDLDRYLLDHRPAATCVDSGGHHTQAVYKFCRDRLRRRVYAVKGMAGPGRPVWPKKSSKGMAGKAILFLIGVDAAKDQVFAHLKLTTAGPGYCHFPVDRDERYFAGLSSETVVTKYSKGFPVREYRKRQGVRNEPLDCRVYAYTALCALNVKWPRLEAQVAAMREQERAAKALGPGQGTPASPPSIGRRRGHFGSFGGNYGQR